MSGKLSLQSRLAIRRSQQRALLKRFIARAEEGWLGDYGRIAPKYQSAAITFFRAIHDFERLQGAGPFVVQHCWLRFFEGGNIYGKARQLLALLESEPRAIGSAKA